MSDVAVLADPNAVVPEAASIYGLFDKDGMLRYIGKAKTPASRLRGHMRDCLVKKTPVCLWLRKNGKPEMRILEKDCVDWQEAERRWIALARENGIKLLNVADGGNEPFCSTETRRQNGFDSIARGMQPKTEKPITRTQLIRDAYVWLAAWAKQTNDVVMQERILGEMRDRYQQDPAEFRFWAKV